MKDEASNRGGEGGNMRNLTMEQLAELIRTTVNEALHHNRPLTPPITPPASSVPLSPPPPPEQLEAMWEEIRRIWRHVEDRSAHVDRESSFSLAILDENLSVNFRQPPLKSMTGALIRMSIWEDSIMLHYCTDI